MGLCVSWKGAKTGKMIVCTRLRIKARARVMRWGCISFVIAERKGAWFGASCDTKGDYWHSGI
jgi:hypothetical protein